MLLIEWNWTQPLFSIWLIFPPLLCVQFDEPAATYATVRYSTPFHIEIDKANSSRILASFYNSLGYVSQGKSEPYAIVGSGGHRGYQDGIGNQARFNSLTGFCQINKSHVLLADYDNYCIRLVDREKRSATTAAGQCTNWEVNDGPLLEAGFYRPVNIIRGFDSGSYLVTDHHNYAIRDLNLRYRNVSTYVKSTDKLYFPIDLVYDGVSRLYVTLRFKVVYINTNNREITTIYDDERNKIIMLTHNTFWMSKNRDLHTDKTIKQLSRCDSCDSRWNITDIITWPGTAPQALLLNISDISDRRLYVAELRVVSLVRFTVEGDPQPLTTRTTTLDLSTASAKTKTAVTQSKITTGLSATHDELDVHRTPSPTTAANMTDIDDKQMGTIGKAVVIVVGSLTIMVSLTVVCFFRRRIKKTICFATGSAVEEATSADEEHEMQSISREAADNYRNESEYQQLGLRADHEYATYSIDPAGATPIAVENSADNVAASCKTTDNPYVDMGSKSGYAASGRVVIQQTDSDDTSSVKSWEVAVTHKHSPSGKERDSGRSGGAGVLKWKRPKRKKEKKPKGSESEPMIRESIAVQPSDAHEDASQLSSDNDERPLSADINLYLDPPMLFPEGTMSRPQSPVESRSQLLSTTSVSEFEHIRF